MNKNTGSSAPGEREFVPPGKLYVILRGAVKARALFFGQHADQLGGVTHP